MGMSDDGICLKDKSYIVDVDFIYLLFMYVFMYVYEGWNIDINELWGGII